MIAVQPGLCAHQERRQPQPGLEAARMDVIDEELQPAWELPIDALPVADLGLPAVVDLHVLDRQLIPPVAELFQVGENRVLSHALPEAVPGAPACRDLIRWRRPHHAPERIAVALHRFERCGCWLDEKPL